ncbi:MAG: protein kinase family protein [Micrococcales bacterium]|nr:protein kinase family protein [Micrococcales bacterium]
MYGVGTGRLIADRYALTERRAHLGSIEVWSAVDNTLGREVAVTVFPSNLSRADAIVDAARRSAALNDHRLVRVLDVGTGDDMSWLVEEPLTESASIADLVARGPLPPEEARRIAGEVASGLDVAASRGLHHLHVTPHSVRRTDGGLIKIAGLATAAALEGTEEPDPARAERVDAVATVALMYAAMTTRWPLPQAIPGLQQAPRIVGGVVAPSEITLAVPPDLDAICRATLNHDTGPRSPKELVARITPWSHTIVRHVAPKASPVSRPAAPVTERIPIVPAQRRSGQAPGDRRNAGLAAGAAAGGAGPIARVREHREQEREARAATTRRRLEERRADPNFLNLPEAMEEQRNAPLPPPAPLIPQTPEIEGRHAKLILAVVAGVIVAAMALAVPTLTGMFSGKGSESSAPTATSRPASSASGAGTSVSTRGATTPAALATGAAIAPVTVTAFDPQGDGKENNAAAKRAIDGKASTAWTSEGYKDPSAIGGQKDGVGLVIELPDSTQLKNVKLDLGAGDEAVTLYSADRKSLDGATSVGSVSGSGEQSVTLKTPSTSRYLIVWVTKAARGTDGKYRAQIGDISLSS